MGQSGVNEGIQVAGGSISRGDRLRLAPALVGKPWAAVTRNPYCTGRNPAARSASRRFFTR